MTRMTKRLEDGMAAMDCVACARQGVVCHLLSCRNRLKNRLCDYEDVMQSNGLVKQKNGWWIELPSMEPDYKCSECGRTYAWWEPSEAHYCPNCGAKMDGDGNG